MFITVCLWYVYYSMLMICLLQYAYNMFITVCLWYVYYSYAYDMFVIICLICDCFSTYVNCRLHWVIFTSSICIHMFLQWSSRCQVTSSGQFRQSSCTLRRVCQGYRGTYRLLHNILHGCRLLWITNAVNYNIFFYSGHAHFKFVKSHTFTIYYNKKCM